MSRELYRRHARPRAGQILHALGLDVEYHRAEGDYLHYRDEEGREVRVLDFLGGYGALILGHNHPELVAVARRSLDEQAPFLAQLSCRSETGKLAAKLNQMMVARTGKSFVTTLASTGAEAVEAAMKHAEYAHTLRIERLGKRLDAIEAAVRRGLQERRYRLAERFFERARSVLGVTGPDDFERVALAVRASRGQALAARPKFIALERAFHGKTLGAVSVTHYHEYRRHFARVTPESTFVAAGDEAALEEAVRAATVPYFEIAVSPKNEVELRESRHTNVSALLVEPMQGEGGIRPVPRPFLEKCRALATAHEFPLVFDEIQCGMGRTGTFLYSEQSGVSADYYVLSKGLGGGLAKISALLVESSRYEPEFGLIHTSTFAEDHHASAIALRTLELLDVDDGPMQACAERGRRLKLGLLDVQDEYPEIVHDVRGAGLMLGVEFDAPPADGSAAIRAIYEQGYLGYVISSYLLHQHGIRVAPCMSNRGLLRLEPSALVSAAACDQVVSAFRRVCEILHAQNAYELLRFAVERPSDDGDSAPIRSFRGAAEAPSPPEGLAVSARVAFIGYFVEAAHLAQWDPSLALFGDAEREALLARISAVMGPIVVDEHVVHSDGGRSVGFTVVGIPIDSKTFARKANGGEREELVEKVQGAVALARDRGCSVAALGGYTSIVTGNGMSLDATGLALTTGNALTVAMGIEATMRATRRVGIELREARLAVVGANGNIGSTYAQVLAESVPRLMLVGRSGRGAELRAVAAEIYANAARDLAAAAASGAPRPGGVAAALSTTRAMAEALVRGVRTLDAPRLCAAIDEELGERAPIRVTTELGMLRDANVIVTASSAPSYIIDASMIGRGPVVVCDVAVPSDVHPSVREVAGVTVVDGGTVRLPKNPDLTVRGLDLPPGHLFACAAEALLLGLAGRRDHFSYGAIRKEQVVEILRLAGVYGFVLGAGRRVRDNARDESSETRRTFDRHFEGRTTQP